MALCLATHQARVHEQSFVEFLTVEISPFPSGEKAQIATEASYRVARLHREAEGVVRKKASTGLRQLDAESHGFTDFAMAISNLLGFNLCPRLKNLKSRRIHLPLGFEAPAILSQLVKRDATTKDTEGGWADPVRSASRLHGSRKKN